MMPDDRMTLPVDSEGLRDWMRAHAGELPLQRAIRFGGVPVLPPDEVMLNGQETGADGTRLRVGVFFRSLLPGCACSDDPSPEQEFQEYAELELLVDHEGRVLALRLLD